MNTKQFKSGEWFELTPYWAEKTKRTIAHIKHILAVDLKKPGSIHSTETVKYYEDHLKKLQKRLDDGGFILNF